MGTLYIVIVCAGLPAMGLIYLQRRHSVMVPFLCGMIVFFISQIVLRIPLLQLLQQSFQIQLFFQFHSIIYVFMLAFTAGLFEEIGRYIGYHYLKRHRSMYDAIAFGLGHGCIEAILLTALPIVSMGILPIEHTFFAGWERIFAMGLHISFSIIVWKGIITSKKCYLILAIVLHTVCDFLAGILIYMQISLVFIEVLLGIISVVLFSICYRYILKGAKV